MQEIITNELENLDFSDLIHVSDEDVEQYRWRVPEEAVTDVPETAPVPQREPFPYSVGDTVYLEDGKPFIIESIGLFDISLRDPSLRYPVSRAESRESFARLMERYPQPEQAPAYTEQTVAVYPADKNNLPYDVEIRTLRFDEPEHDPLSAEPAKPEPPAMNEEERLILEHEGRAALSEMGEFVPDFDDAISQAEIDEPPAHRPAVSIPVDGEWQGFPSVAAAEQAAYADFKAASHRDAQNFHITDDALGVGGAVLVAVIPVDLQLDGQFPDGPGLDGLDKAGVPAQLQRRQTEKLRPRPEPLGPVDGQQLKIRIGHGHQMLFFHKLLI